MKRSQIIELIIHLLFWLPFPIFLILTTESLTFGVFVTSDAYFEIALIYGIIFNAFLLYFTIYKILPHYFKQRKYLMGILISLIFYFAICVIEGLVDYIFISTLYDSSDLRDFTDNVIGYVFISSLLLNIPFIIFAYSYRFTKDWYLNERLKYKLKEEKLISELQFLKSQINPHFLFNSLNNLYGMARQINAIPVADGIAKLSNLMRYMLYDSEVDKVSIEKEINYIQDYVELQKLRIQSSEKINITVNINNSFNNIKIAPLLLIPFVENAFKHGISIKENSEITIELITNDDSINFNVTNTINKLRKNRDEENSGFGLKNVQKRLNLIYPNKYKLNIKEDNYIYSVSLKIDTTT